MGFQNIAITAMAINSIMDITMNCSLTFMIVRLDKIAFNYHQFLSGHFVHCIGNATHSDT